MASTLRGVRVDRFPACRAASVADEQRLAAETLDASKENPGCEVMNDQRHHTRDDDCPIPVEGFSVQRPAILVDRVGDERCARADHE